MKQYLNLKKGADMQKVFENIIDKLELNSFEMGKDIIPIHYVRLNKAIEIVKQEAEKYNNGHFGCNTNGEHEKCNGCGLTDCKNRNKIWFGVSDDNNGWIPCSERLPEEHELYDITFKNSAGIHSDSAIYNPYLKRWLWDADETELVENEILAWAEKREPYHPKGE